MKNILHATWYERMMRKAWAASGVEYFMQESYWNWVISIYPPIVNTANVDRYPLLHPPFPSTGADWASFAFLKWWAPHPAETIMTEKVFR